MNSKIQPGAIVVPWDFTVASTIALDTAIRMNTNASTIRVIHVAASMEDGTTTILREPTRARCLDEWKDRFRQQISYVQDCHTIAFYVEYGPVAEEVAAFAKRYDASLIVVGSHQHSCLARFFRPSLIRNLIRLAHCPVLVAKQPSNEIPRVPVC